MTAYTARRLAEAAAMAWVLARLVATVLLVWGISAAFGVWASVYQARFERVTAEWVGEAFTAYRSEPDPFMRHYWAAAIHERRFRYRQVTGVEFAVVFPPARTALHECLEVELTYCEAETD